MSEENNQNPTGENSSGSAQNNNWQEVGRQFEELGQSLAQAFRTTWNDAESQRRVNEMRTGLESMVRDVGKAIEDTANSPEGQKIRGEAERTVESLRTASEQTIQEVRPQLIGALQQLNNELQKFIIRMENRPSSDNSESGSDSES